MEFWRALIRVELYLIVAACVGFVVAYWTVPVKNMVGWHLLRVTVLLGTSAFLAATAQTFSLAPEIRQAAWALLLLFIAIEMVIRTRLLIQSRIEARQEMRMLRQQRDTSESERTRVTE